MVCHVLQVHDQLDMRFRNEDSIAKPVIPIDKNISQGYILSFFLWNWLEHSADNSLCDV